MMALELIRIKIVVLQDISLLDNTVWDAANQNTGIQLVKNV